MRIAVAEIAQETDSFSPMAADLKDFEAYGLYFGDEILERMPGVGPIGGFLEVAAERSRPSIVCADHAGLGQRRRNDHAPRRSISSPSDSSRG